MALTKETELKILIAYLVTNYVLLFPVIVYGLMLLKRNWKKTFLIKRKRVILVTRVVIFSYVIVIGLPLIAFASVFSLEHTSPISHEINFQLNFMLPLITALWLWVVRFYALYYDYRYAEVLSNKSWIEVINPSVIENNWILRHRHTYGSAVYLCKCAMIAALLSALCFALLYEIHQGISLLFLVAINVVVTVLCGSLWRKYPQHDDNFGIRREMIFSVKVVSVVLLVIAVPITAAEFLFDEMSVDHVISAWGATIFCFSILAVLLFYGGRANVVPKLPARDSSLADYIQDKSGYEKFMHFLSLEFAMENLLFLTEYLQLLNVLSTAFPNRADLSGILADSIRVPSDIAFSRIAGILKQNLANQTDADSTSHIMKAFSSLYTKYIEANQAPFEINISYLHRRPLDVLHAAELNANNIDIDSNEKALDTALPLYQTCRYEMVLFLLESFHRFEVSHL